MTETLPPNQETINEFVIAAHHDLNKVKQMLAGEPLLLNQKAQWQETPIQAATHVGNQTIVEYLLAEGAPLDICTAAMMGKREELSAMLREDPTSINARGAHNLPLLYYATIYDRVDIAELLLAAGADINAGVGSNTALHGAATFGQANIARWLIDHGADIIAKDFNGKTPHEVAVERGHMTIADLISDES
ncbi:MAG: ankyrin repeat domain-containing protein [Anaerolineae bacterium]|nr:ankyrin repeat domain-containing protein [Anaerolineae bacterium]MCA9909076.1 ankyrin repeat domain-containing protein [Anaerolineae bacterium]